VIEPFYKSLLEQLQELIVKICLLIAAYRLLQWWLLSVISYIPAI